MARYYGTQKITGRHLGTRRILERYLGTRLVWQAVPDQPSAPTVTASGRNLSATWTAVARVASWRVRYRTGSGTWTDGGTTTTTTWSVSSLAYSTTYEVQVQAVNDTGSSLWSPSGSATTGARPGPVLPSPPPRPSAPSVSIRGRTATVTWATVSRATSWSVRYRTGTNAWVTANTGSRRSFSVTLPLYSTQYEFQVLASNSGGSSSWSTSGTGTTGARPAPPIPSNSTLAASWTSATATTATGSIGWTAYTGAASYTYVRRRAGSAEFTRTMNYPTGRTVSLVLSTATSEARSGHGVVTLTEYAGTNGTGRVVARTTYTIPRYTGTVTPPPADVLSAPNFSLSPRPNGFQISYTGIPARARFVGYQYRVSGTTVWIEGSASILPGTTSTTLTISRLAPLTTYQVQVRSATTTETSVWTSARVVTTPAPAPRLAVPFHRVTARANNVFVSWNTVTGATSYDVQFGFANGTGTFTINRTRGPYDFTNALYSTGYRARIRARNASTIGAWSSWKSATTGARPAPPLPVPSLRARLGGTIFEGIWTAEVNRPAGTDATVAQIEYLTGFQAGQTETKESDASVGSTVEIGFSRREGTARMRARTRRGTRYSAWTAWQSLSDTG